MRKSQCCQLPGFFRELRKRPTIVADLSSSALQATLLHSAQIAWVSIAGAEQRHACHRRICSPQMPWPVFAGVAICQEAKTLLQGRRTARQSSATSAPESQLKPQSQPQRQAGDELRGQSAFLLFRKDWLKEQREAGKCRKHVIDSEVWKECRLAFESLSADSRANYDRQSLASRTVARLNRDQNRRLAGDQEKQPALHDADLGSSQDSWGGRKFVHGRQAESLRCKGQ